MELYELLVLSRLLKYVRTLESGIYYLSKEERDMIARFNEEAEKGEANRLYLLQMAQSLKLNHTNSCYCANWLAKNLFLLLTHYLAYFIKQS